MGQSGQPGHSHYADMIGPWQRGEMIHLRLDGGMPGGDPTQELNLFP